MENNTTVLGLDQREESFKKEEELLKPLTEKNPFSEHQARVQDSEFDYTVKSKNQLLTERESVIKMRIRRGYRVLILLFLIVFFNFVVTILAGLSVLNFNGVTLPFFIGQSLLQVLGLGYIVTKFLFNEASFSGK